MLKTMIAKEERINIDDFCVLHGFMKRKSDSYITKKSNIFSNEEIFEFLTEAPDSEFLLDKIIAILGFCGACRCDEIVKTKLTDIVRHGKMFNVNIQKAKTKTPRSYAVPPEFYKYMSAYIKIRMNVPVSSDKFLLAYHNGKCRKQETSIKKVYDSPKRIATFLNLDQPKKYTGHAFRRTAGTIAGNNGLNAIEVGNFGGWKSFSVCKNYVEQNDQSKKKLVKLYQEQLLVKIK